MQGLIWAGVFVVNLVVCGGLLCFVGLLLICFCLGWWVVIAWYSLVWLDCGLWYVVNCVVYSWLLCLCFVVFEWCAGYLGFLLLFCVNSVVMVTLLLVVCC